MSLIVTRKPRNYIHPEFLELSRYLGTAFNYDWCNFLDEKGHKDAQSERYKNPEDFVRNTYVFMYQNIGLMSRGLHRPYIAKLLDHTVDRSPISVIDVGAGGGQLGLALHTLGYDVSFSDIYSQSLLWLLWRLRERRLDLPVYVLDESFEESDDYTPRDVVMCLDTIEHIPSEKQADFLTRLSKMGNTVIVNLIRGDGTELPGLHNAVDIDYLTKYCLDNWVTWWGNYYLDKDTGLHRQRLLIYGNGLTLEEKEKIDETSG